MTCPPWSRLVAGALLVHAAWGLARVPTKVVARRLEHVQEHRQQGDAAALFASSGLQGADAIAWIVAHTPPDAVIAWTGEVAGAMEFAPALAWPRLFVALDALGPASSWRGRPVATGSFAGASGRIVLVAARESLRLEAR